MEYEFKIHKHTISERSNCWILMKNTLIALFGIGSLLFLLFAFAWIIKANNYDPGYLVADAKVRPPNKRIENKIEALYGACNLANEMDFEVFRQAMIGYFNLPLENNNLLTIINYAQPSDQKRFFVIDFVDKKLLYKTWVAHGVNSGKRYAKRFSNKVDSKQSSLGFFTTAEAYTGQHGYALRLDGVEQGINDKARKRDIVIHSSDYVSEDYLKKRGRMGMSWGCPALPETLNKEIIDKIKSGSLIYMHGKSRAYQEASAFVVD